MKTTDNIGINRKSNDTVIINDIHIRQATRDKKSIGGWRAAHRSAESRSNPDRSRLYDLYDDILLDGHLSGIVQKRICAVLNKGLEYLGPDGRKVDAMDKVIASAPFREVIQLIMETILWGVSGMEFLPGKELQLIPIPRKHIKPEYGIIAYDQNDHSDGIPYEDQPMLWVMHQRSHAHIAGALGQHGLGLLLRCAPYVIYKRDVIADWANYTEVFGQPVRIIRYDAYDEQTRLELRRILEESGSSLALMIPKQAEFEMKDGKQSNGDGQLQERFKSALDQELSIIILGNTETTTNGGTGSQAKSVVHQDQQDLITRSDLAFTLNALNDPHFIGILRSYGLPIKRGGHFAFTREIDIEYLADRIAIDRAVAAIIPVSDDYFYDTYRIPRPANYDELKSTKEKNVRDNTANEQLHALLTNSDPALIAKEQAHNGSWQKFRSMLRELF